MQGKIFTVFHKESSLIKDDLYEPIQVGFLENFGYLRDNTDDNISDKNKNYSELTALYWIWKNLDLDFYGLDHYRRHFSKGFSIFNKANFIDRKFVVDNLNNYDALLPNPRNYFIISLKNHYIRSHHQEDLDVLREVMDEKYPEYIECFDKHLSGTKMHAFNMLIMKKEVFNGYCEWLFDILFEVENRLDISDYDSYNGRVFGFLSERLLDVYINKNNIKYKNISYVFTEKQDWINKIYKFLKKVVSK